jgi:hypothetical protein
MHATLLRLLAHVHLHQDLHPALALVGTTVELPRELLAVDGMIQSKSSTASRALLVWSEPMRCHGTGRPSPATFSFASWTRFLSQSLDSRP